MTLPTRIPSPQKKDLVYTQHSLPNAAQPTSDAGRTSVRSIGRINSIHPYSTHHVATRSADIGDRQTSNFAPSNESDEEAEIEEEWDFRPSPSTMDRHDEEYVQEQGYGDGVIGIGEGVARMVLQDNNQTDRDEIGKNNSVMYSAGGMKQARETSPNTAYAPKSSLASQTQLSNSRSSRAGWPIASTGLNERITRTSSSRVPSSTRGTQAGVPDLQIDRPSTHTPHTPKSRLGFARPVSSGQQPAMAPPRSTPKPALPASGGLSTPLTPQNKRATNLSITSNGIRSSNTRGPVNNRTSHPPAVSTRLRHPPASTTSKTSFNTYLRTFTPTKLASTPSTNPSPRASGPENLAQFRAQTHLLHLTLLSAAAPSTLASYISSARTHLSDTHVTLQSIYTSLLPLLRRVRQYRNLFALNEWSGGNMVGLARRVNTIMSVLEELMGLTSPGDSGMEALEGDEEGDEEGAYSKVIKDFTQWIDWVAGIWSSRDAAASLSTDSALRVAAADDERRAASSLHEAHPSQHQITPIDGLGDAAKSSLRALTTLLHSLSIRLEEVRQNPFPLLTKTTEDPERMDTTTPKQIVDSTLVMVGNMLEELQVMREIEFEVVVGEKAWMEAGLRRLGREIGRGFG